MDADSKTNQGTNSQNGQNNAQTNQLITFSCHSNVDAYNRKKNSEIMWKIHDTFGDAFNGIGCFEGTFSLQL